MQRTMFEVDPAAAPVAWVLVGQWVPIAHPLEGRAPGRCDQGHALRRSGERAVCAECCEVYARQPELF